MEIIGIGTDLVDVERFRLTLERTPRLVHRVFTVGEQEYCEQRGDPTERYAVRFAAKEAALKSMGLGIFSFSLTQIEVVRLPGGSPALELHHRAAEAAAEAGVDGLKVSLTHTAISAQAMVLAYALERS